MSNRPSWGISEAATKCAVSRSTVRRHLEQGKFPNAFKTGSGAWRIPLEDLLAVGWRPVSPAQYEPTSGAVSTSSELAHEQPSDPLTERVSELEHALELERVKRQALEQVNRNYEATLNDLRMALRMLEPAKTEHAERAQGERVSEPSEPARELSDELRSEPPASRGPGANERGLLGWLRRGRR